MYITVLLKRHAKVNSLISSSISRFKRKIIYSAILYNLLMNAVVLMNAAKKTNTFWFQLFKSDTYAYGVICDFGLWEFFWTIFQNYIFISSHKK